VQAGQFTPGRIEREPPPRDVPVEVVTDKTIDEMLASGEVQAATTPYTSRLAGLPDSPIRPLFPEPLAAETDYLARTGIFPIMHLVVVRRTLVERHPWVAVNLVQAFTKAKDLCLERMNGLGGHPPVALPFFLDSVAAGISTERCAALFPPGNWLPDVGASGYPGEQLADVGEFVSPPGHMLVGPDEREVALVEVAGLRQLDVDNGERDPAPPGRFDQRSG
jgi:hypothetical protein